AVDHGENQESLLLGCCASRHLHCFLVTPEKFALCFDCFFPYSGSVLGPSPCWGEDLQCSRGISVKSRVDCHPQPGASQERCEARGCVWCSTEVPNAPWCFFPEDSPYGYSLSGNAEKTIHEFLFTLNVLCFYHLKYQKKSKCTEMSLNTKHKENNYLSSLCHRWDASLNDLIFSNQYLQITTTVPSTSVYGFGEHEHPSFKHSMNFATYGMFSRDQSPTTFANLYGVHPFYMCVETDSNAHGVLLLNSNAQDVSLSPNPSLTFRTIGGILDFYMFLGPTPENVIQQYTEAIGRPHMPAYWSLGFQLSRWGYGSIDVLKETVDRMHYYDIPYDVQHSDIDYMERRLDFTYDKENYAGLPEYIKHLKKEGMHYVLILDPFISKDEEPGTYRPYDLGEEMGVWVNNSDGVTPAVGKAWPDGHSVFPDYTNPRTVEWWTQMCLELKDVLDYDGIWIDMNEPSNFDRGQYPGCAVNEINNPPYIPSISDRALAQKTLCPDSKTYLGDHYNTHSLFGWSQTAPTFHAAQKATGKRAFVLSRSTFVGSGKHGGHWLGDNFSQWKDMHQSIIGILEFNLFGIPYVGADICGFNSDTTYELCLRWMQLGSFYPFSRNHNAEGNSAQDPAVFGAEFAKISRDTLRIRYSLLPYLYTLFYESHVHGNTVGNKVPASWLKSYATVDAPLSKIPLFLRGGYILPTQAPATTTTRSRLNPFGLTIALDDQGEASGSLFWDDGDSIGKFGSPAVKQEIVHNGYRGADTLKYNTITILGLKLRPHAIALNGRAVHGQQS
uniref:alpha-glucosidase n=1 Tax=Nothoprocta perdicaria TaxID=30464 RepID=A0A8C7A103_NOTPE